MKLYPVKREKGDNRYCGPAVISAVTGMSTGEAARLIRHVSGATSVRGTTDAQIIKAFAACKVKMTAHHDFSEAPKRPTIAQWLRDTKAIRNNNRVFLLSAGRHWQIVSGRRYVCGIVKDIVSIRDDRVKRRARVKRVFELFDQGIVIPDAATQKPAPAVPAIQSSFSKSELRTIKREAEAYAIEVEQVSDYLLIYPPDIFGEDDESDPYDDNHMAFSLEEAIERITTYKTMVMTAQARSDMTFEQVTA